MTLTWLLNTASLFFMASGVMLFFVGLWEAPRRTHDPDALLWKHRRLLAIGGIVVSLWFIMQYLAILLG